MNVIAATIARSIKEGKWLHLGYHNQKEDKMKYFWACILDIEPVRRRLEVEMFNHEYNDEVLHGYLYFDQIRSASIIEGTTCEVRHALIEKIMNDLSAYSFLEYAGVNERILQYYLKCYQNDHEGSVQNYKLVNGIDSDIIKGVPYHLSEVQFKEFVENIQLHLKKNKQKFNQKIIRMSINIVCISHAKGDIFPIVYKDLLLDVKKRTLIVSPDYSFNIRLGSKDDQKISFQLSRYFDGDPQDFVANFESHREMYLKNIAENLSRKEILDERPYVFKFQQFIPINIENEYTKIHQAYEADTLCAPLKCFFGLNEKERQRRPRSILLSEHHANIDQLRTVYTAMTQNVVYVQGPPGTGKTSTIVNVILSCLLNNFTSLIVSNNNEAINNIYRKMSTFSYQGKLIFFPILRLGSNQEIRGTLKKLADLLPVIEGITFEKGLHKQVMGLAAELKSGSQELEKALRAYEEEAEVSEQLESLQAILQDIAKNEEVDEISKSMAAAGIKAQMQNLMQGTKIHEEYEEQMQALQVDQDILLRYLYLRSLEAMQKLTQKKHENLHDLLLIQDEKERLQEFKNLLADSDGVKQLLDIFPFLISTNVSCAKIGEATPLFDLMIMDEASQCSNALALLPMARCKRAIFVGDQNQLQPVIVMNSAKNAALMNSYDIPAAYDYKKNSILSTLLKIDTLSKFILLREHYRCNDKIIQFSNQKYYDNELKLCSSLHNVDALKLIDVKSSAANEKNTSREEVETLMEEIRKSPYKDIAVITPYRRQAELIERTLTEEGMDHVKVGTIHTFQGDEKDQIILCSGISEASQNGSFNWLKNNQELLNVATTRAKENLTLICDVSRVKELSQDTTNDFLELVDYIRSDGNYQVAYHENEVFTSKVKNFKYYNTKAEEEFLHTLLHIKSVYGQLHIQTKVKVSDVLDISHSDALLFRYGNQAHFDFVVYDLMRKPLLAIEVIGSEHFSEQKVRERDRKKREICKSHDLRLITIRNDYVRRYSYIKDAIMKALNE